METLDLNQLLLVSLWQPATSKVEGADSRALFQKRSEKVYGSHCYRKWTSSRTRCLFRSEKGKTDKFPEHGCPNQIKIILANKKRSLNAKYLNFMTYGKSDSA